MLPVTAVRKERFVYERNSGIQVYKYTIKELGVDEEYTNRNSNYFNLHHQPALINLMVHGREWQVMTTTS